MTDFGQIPGNTWHAALSSWQLLDLALRSALAKRFFVKQVVLGLVQKLVGCLDSAIADTSNTSDLLGGYIFSKVMGSHVNAGGCHRERRTAGQGANLNGLLRNVDADILDICLVPNAKLRHVASDKVVGASRLRLLVIVNLGEAVETNFFSLRTQVLKEFFQSLEGTTDFFLGNLG